MTDQPQKREYCAGCGHVTRTPGKSMCGRCWTRLPASIAGNISSALHREKTPALAFNLKRAYDWLRSHPE